jgi:hypothetical protein
MDPMWWCDFRFEFPESMVCFELIRDSVVVLYGNSPRQDSIEIFVGENIVTVGKCPEESLGCGDFGLVVRIEGVNGVEFRELAWTNRG